MGPPVRHPRLGVASRVVCAAAGGYGVAALVAILLAVALPGPPLERATAGTLAALPVMPPLAMLVFWMRSAARAWAAVAALAAILAALAGACGWRP